MRDELQQDADLMSPCEEAECTARVDELSRRTFVQSLGAGLLITILPGTTLAQRGRSRGGSSRAPVAMRVHVGNDGVITVMTGKVEGGQGARTELTQAAAEELRVPVGRINLVMADTSVVPDDGSTAGSRTTPSTVPAVREACAATREALVGLAMKQWNAAGHTAEVHDGRIVHTESKREITYADLAAEADLADALTGAKTADVQLTPVKDWKVLGASVARPNARDIVTGTHRYPSDIVRPGMLRGKILRRPSYGAKLKSIDLDPAKGMKDVVVVQDGDFIGVAAPTIFQADRALEVIAATAKWEPSPHPSSKEVFAYLKQHARDADQKNPFADDVAKAAKALRQEYHVAYVQHAPLEPRAAVAEWVDGKLTVWVGSQNPFGCHSELVRAFGLPNDQVRVIVPDFGAGFGGKHSPDAHVEAAHLAKAAGKPVSVRWTREEEFTWAYFRPAAVIVVEAGLDADGTITSWHFVNINSGAAAIDTPYRIAKARSRFVQSDSPLRQSSYRCLAATANNFARECFMDELAEAAGRDPLAFRLDHLENPRLRAVLEAAGERFGWSERANQKHPGVGIGLACGIEKNSVVAACVEIAIDREQKQIDVRKVCQIFECGAVLNPENLMAQIKGCIIMGLGPALREAMAFEGGRIRNASFCRYAVPRFKNLPELDIHVLNRPDLPSAGAGETPIIAIAPAIANAVAHAAGTRIRGMPIRLQPA